MFKMIYLISGISGPMLSALEKAVDEIIGFQAHTYEPEIEEPRRGPRDGEYMNNKNLVNCPLIKCWVEIIASFLDKESDKC